MTSWSEWYQWYPASPPPLQTATGTAILPRDTQAVQKSYGHSRLMPRYRPFLGQARASLFLHGVAVYPLSHLLGDLHQVLVIQATLVCTNAALGQYFLELRHRPNQKAPLCWTLDGQIIVDRLSAGKMDRAITDELMTSDMKTTQ